MDLFAVNNFIETFQKIDEGHAYIASANGRVYRVANKESKNLKTADIAALGQDALNTLRDLHTSYSAKAASCEKLGQSLQACVNRVYGHKNFWQKVAWWLGITSIAWMLGMDSHGERELRNACNETKNLAENLRTQDSNAKETVQTNTTLFTDKLNRDLKAQLQLLYMGVFDSSPLEIKELDGIDPRYASLWLLKHLQNYQQKIGPEKAYAATVDSAIQEFQVHNDLLFAEFEENDAFTSAWTGLKIEDWTIHEILGQFLNLKNPGDEVTIGGGYRRSKDSNLGHSVQYVFRKENDGFYSLTFVNTGEGIEYSALLQDSLYATWNAIWGNSHLDRIHLKDDVWMGIPREALTAEFVTILVEKRMKQIPTCMAEIKQDVSNYLRRFPSLREGKGREHKIQKKGSCTVKSLASWLHERLGDHIWRDFKAFYTSQEMQKLDYLTEQIPNSQTRETFKSEGQRIIQKREKKKIQYFEQASRDASLQKPSRVTQIFKWWR